MRFFKSLFVRFTVGFIVLAASSGFRVGGIFLTRHLWIHARVVVVLYECWRMSWLAVFAEVPRSC